MVINVQGKHWDTPERGPHKILACDMTGESLCQDCGTHTVGIMKSRLYLHKFSIYNFGQIQSAQINNH